MNPFLAIHPAIAKRTNRNRLIPNRSQRHLPNFKKNWKKRFRFLLRCKIFSYCENNSKELEKFYEVLMMTNLGKLKVRYIKHRHQKSPCQRRSRLPIIPLKHPLIPQNDNQLLKHLQSLLSLLQTNRNRRRKLNHHGKNLFGAEISRAS